MIIEIEDLAKLVTAYQQRKFDEDVAYLENDLGGKSLDIKNLKNNNPYVFFLFTGIGGLSEKLKVNLDMGLSSTDLDIREKHFGTNKKEMPPRTPFWTFFIKALDDFMLKMLLVCACINIGFEVGFAKPKDRSHGKFYTLCTVL